MATTTKEPERGRSSSQVSLRDPGGADNAGNTTFPRIISRHNKIYRAPPTPPLDRLIDLEKSFVLDSVAVSNISTDYSRANPKLGSVIPPYNSFNDRAIARYFENYGVRDMLKKKGQLDNSESIAGRAHDKFFTDGAGFRYLTSRNKFGNGKHPETYEGHRRYMGENGLRVMIGYNNMYGYRRNIPKLRTEPPSTFNVDPRWFERLKRSHGEHMDEDELIEHFKHTYLIGYPFYDNNFNNFHPSVKYIITVKVGELSPDEYKGNLGINIVAKNFDTGFIKLDENIVKETYNKKKDKQKDENGEKKRTLFRRNRTDVFEFEDQDIRTISAILISKDVKGEEVLYLDYIDVVIQKPNESQSYRFPCNGWVRGARQDKKSEEIKERFGKKNSLVLCANEQPKFDYMIVVAPRLFRDTEYTIELVNFDVCDAREQSNYEIEFGPKTELPKTGRLVVSLFQGRSKSADGPVVFYFDHQTPSVDAESPFVFSMPNRELEKIKYATVMYEDKSGETECFVQSFQVIDPDGEVFLFEIEEKLKPNKEVKIPSKFIKNEDETDEESPLKKGKLFLKLVGMTQSTGFFLLKEAAGETNKKIFKFNINELYVDTIQSLRIRYEGSKKDVCKIKSIKVRSNKGHHFVFDRRVLIRNKEEVTLNNRSKSKKALKGEAKPLGQLMLQVFGEKKNTDLFALKDPNTNENDLDEFFKSENDIGKVKSVYLKYDDAAQNKNTVTIKYVEVIDPRGNSYKFVMDASLKSGESITLPRKPGTKPREEDEKKPEPEADKKNDPSPRQTKQREPETIEYEVKVIKGVGAANVPISLKIFGDKGVTEKMVVESKSESIIDIGKEGSVKIKGADVGKIQKVSLDYEAKGLKSAWYLNEIQVMSSGQLVKFPVERAFINDETIELRPNEKPPGIDVKSMNPLK